MTVDVPPPERENGRTRSSRPINRRSLIGALAAGVIGAAAPEGGARGDDPILAAIEAHAKAYAELDEALARQEVLEGPFLERSSGFDEAELFIDPIWIALQLELDSLHDEETRASIALIQIEPSTAAGAATLMRHIALLEGRGYQWPGS